MKFKGLTEIILCLWLLVSAFLGFGTNSSAWNYFIVGIVVVCVNFFLIHGKPQQSWIAGILGFWLIIVAIAPFYMQTYRLAHLLTYRALRFFGDKGTGSEYSNFIVKKEE